MPEYKLDRELLNDPLRPRANFVHSDFFCSYIIDDAK